MSAHVPARKLPTKMVSKVWGRDSLPSPFAAPAGERIGEIWFEPPQELPQILVKYLFTSEKLSVQVHPGDHNAIDDEAGKEECWLVLNAEPGATLAIGFDKEITPDQMAAAARDGTIENLLTWHEVKAGDIYYLPAGTVHAIGPGLALVEVQQSSDTTFRLFDYGRPRELHLDRAIAVADGVPYPAQHQGTMAERGTTLIDGPHFRIDRIAGIPDAETIAVYQNGLLVLPLEGEVAPQQRSGDEADGAVRAGECLYAASIDMLDFSDAGVTILIRPAL
ncbi:mannose-6-phosphate isomerase [Erythrobacter insulae]|uniref:Mannose-6-phosphate isomerase n=1 Tax=Erythrobacter insulae TaxID=2584124 RepID=A0A547PAA4_9SPHN|nr:class I mannose-6-phosphate isomerase [Erythrobacter insulae]TRD10974.1 mannose-6-phosphate isomerase [Erythrobacter insulae]